MGEIEKPSEGEISRMSCTYIIHMKTVAKMLWPLALLSQAPQNVHSRAGVIHRNCLRLNWILLRVRPGSVCLSEQSTFFPSFHSFHSMQASSTAIHNRGSWKKYSVWIVWAKWHQFLCPSLSGVISATAVQELLNNSGAGPVMEALALMWGVRETLWAVTVAVLQKLLPSRALSRCQMMCASKIRTRNLIIGLGMQFHPISS